MPSITPTADRPSVRLERCPVTEILCKLGLQSGPLGSSRLVHQGKRRRTTAVPFVLIQTSTRTVIEPSAPAFHAGGRGSLTTPGCSATRYRHRSASSITSVELLPERFSAGGGPLALALRTNPPQYSSSAHRPASVASRGSRVAGGLIGPFPFRKPVPATSSFTFKFGHLPPTLRADQVND